MLSPEIADSVADLERADEIMLQVTKWIEENLRELSAPDVDYLTEKLSILANHAHAAADLIQNNGA